MDDTMRTLSEYAASLTYADITPQAVHSVKRSLIDSIGCALGAFHAEPAEIGRRLASRISSTTPATLWGTKFKTSPDWAAFVNGVMVRYLDFSDDYIVKDGPHPSDSIPAVLAIAEALHADGKSLACAITLTYEIIDQLVDVAEFSSRGWDYVTEHSAGSAMGAGKLLGFSQEKMAHAIALALTPNIGLYQTRTGQLSMWKGCAGPNGARNGIFAAMLAGEGMTGPDLAIEGRYGLWNQVTGRFQLGRLGGHGHPFKVEDTFFKYRPMMYPVMLPVEIALEMRRDLDIDDIDSIRVVLDHFSRYQTTLADIGDPRTRETADHSLPYLVVNTLIEGEVTKKTFTAERFRDPKVLALVKKFTIEESEAYTREFPKAFNCLIEVTGKSGRKWVMEKKNPKGHPGNPMSDTEIEEKFLKLTQNMLSPKQAKSTLELVWHLDEIDDVGRILDAIII